MIGVHFFQGVLEVYFSDTAAAESSRLYLDGEECIDLRVAIRSTPSPEAVGRVHVPLEYCDGGEHVLRLVRPDTIVEKKFVLPDARTGTHTSLYVDQVRMEGDVGRIMGWAYDWTQPDLVVRVCLRANDCLLAEAPAHLYRGDLHELGLREGRLGFAFTITEPDLWLPNISISSEPEGSIHGGLGELRGRLEVVPARKASQG